MDCVGRTVGIDADVVQRWQPRASSRARQNYAAGSCPGIHGVYAGRLRNAHQVESLVASLISVNRRHKAHTGLRVTDA